MVMGDYCGLAVKIEPHNRTVRQQNYVHEIVLFRNMGDFFPLNFVLSPKTVLNVYIIS